MEKQKRWQHFLILAVVFLTIYNILPTVFYYSKPLKKPIDEAKGLQIAQSISNRINNLEQDATAWLHSFCSLLRIKPSSIVLDPKQPELISLSFKTTEDASKLRHYLPRAGSLIPFVPEQLFLYQQTDPLIDKTVIVQRHIPVHFEQKELDQFYQFSTKKDAQGKITPLWNALVIDRLLQLGLALGGPSENGGQLLAASEHPDEPQAQELLLLQANNLLSFVSVFGETSSMTTRYFQSFTRLDTVDRRAVIEKFISALNNLKAQFSSERTALEQESKALQNQNSFLDTIKQERLSLLLNREKTVSSAEKLLKKNAAIFAAGSVPLTYTSLGALIQAARVEGGVQTLSLKDSHPFISHLVIDWNNEKISLQPYPELLLLKAKLSQKEQLEQIVYNEIAGVSRQTAEIILPMKDNFEIGLSALQNSSSFLAMRLGNVAKTIADQTKKALLLAWTPTHSDLAKNAYPVVDYQEYTQLPSTEQRLALVVYAPALQNQAPLKGFRMNSVYVIAKGMGKILEKVQAAPHSAQAKQFAHDFNQLRSLLQQSGFFGYNASLYPFGTAFAGDYIFEAEDYYQTLLKASRENFAVHGTRRYGVLEFSDVEQRILTQNKIETRMHEDLLKWRDDYRAAQLDIRGASPYDVPAPTKNILLNNFKLSAVKYFRGDERKVLHWGLDLSGGKTVQIELRDNNHRKVTDTTDLRQGVNELYTRVNKMGVSEISIRQEGDYITLDFPGSQGLSAAELIKASSMYFHVVNEKFSTSSSLSSTVGQFLQEVWNEAVVTGRKDIEEINWIAWKHLYGQSMDPSQIEPRSPAAKMLYDSGLRLANPEDNAASSLFDDTLSKIALLRGESFTEWHGQSHPLLIVFRNYALEGSSLENVHASYDPSKGNFLAFSVKGSHHLKSGQKINPRDDLFAWSSQFSKEKIAGTPNEVYTKGHGWRMAVALNGTVISSPTLDSPLRDHAMITGSFSQREVSQLEADLKAGSLSFTPRILSEKNVSPELGAKERMLGVLATIIALALVIITMVSYYRFGGVVASIAVLLNLLIMWATLQNLHATMTLAGIAGIILTVAMAVDANVLVFERIREEFAVSGRIASAVHAGYRKAFSAIIDSNVTTIIAALILLHFDSGPIRGLAVTLIIGIVSSLFTALFMTRYFFSGWVQNPAHKELKMANFIRGSAFNFLKHTKKTVIFSALTIAVGLVCLVSQKQALLGMDFTGGFAVNLELQPLGSGSYRASVEKALIASGARAHDVQVRELNPTNQVRIFLSRNLEEPGHPFFSLPAALDVKDLSYPYETNPKLVWIIAALQKANLSPTAQSLENLDKNWTQVSGQMSDTMRNSALIGLGCALLCILVYITIRFEFKYAISATLCLAHDVLFVIATIALLHFLKVPVQIDLNTVAALMTIVGYSLNDTIIVFDRIREDHRLMRKSPFHQIINHALNVTLSRTLMTSGITLLVLLPLVFLGGSTIFGFALVMIIGVVFGTLSSLFIAAPLMQYFHHREEQKQQNLALE